MLCDEKICGVGHNEDNDWPSVENGIFLKVTMGNHSFTCFNYAGDLPTTAFGFNNKGIHFL